MHLGIQILLELGAGRVAKENPAPKRAYGVHATQFPNLEWTSPTWFFFRLCKNRERTAEIEPGWGNDPIIFLFYGFFLGQIKNEPGQFHRGDVEPMTEFIEMTAPPR